jgi:homoserine dehydrogenase
LKKRVFGVGVIGAGVVGGGVVRELIDRSESLLERAGVELRLARVADIDQGVAERIGIESELVTTDAESLITDPQVDIVVELIGGEHPAKDLILRAFSEGKHVVTANKLLIAKHAAELCRAAEEHGVELRFEASVCGGIPILKALREGLAANRIERVLGIVNGTANYILTQMTRANKSYEEALKDAQDNGFAEADPTLDVEGHDSAHKLRIIASLVFSTDVDLEDVYVEGVTGVTSEDVEYARELGYVIKLLAIARRVEDEIDLRVHPTLIPQDFVLADVNNEYNAVYVEGDVVGTTLYYGKGAGRFPTTSAILADLIDVAKDIQFGSVGRMKPFVWGPRVLVKDMKDLQSHYYLRFTTVDKPGVLGQICSVLGDNNVSIASVIQKTVADDETKPVPIVLMTHMCSEGDIHRALQKIDSADAVRDKTHLIRVEEHG